jgi:hypothetical protein
LPGPFALAAGVSRKTGCLGSSALIVSSGESGAASKYGRVTRIFVMYLRSTKAASDGSDSATVYRRELRPRRSVTSPAFRALSAQLGMP